MKKKIGTYSVIMSSKHLQTGDARPAFDNTKKFRIYSMKFCPFAQVCTKYMDNNLDYKNIQLKLAK